MALPTRRVHRDKQTSEVKKLLKAGQLSEALYTAIVAQSISTLRIHDSGDFFNPLYTKSWIEVCKRLPDVQFWTYTRSYTVPKLLEQLLALAELKNVAVWLSADGDNWLQALSIYRLHSDKLAGIAFMEQSDTQEIASALASQLPAKNFVNFPVHSWFGRLKVTTQDIPNCPAVTKELPHSEIPACLVCRKCLTQD